MKKSTLGIVFAILAALCYSLVNPINKLINSDISPLFSASMLYFGTFLVGLIYFLVQIIFKKYQSKDNLEKKDIPFLLLAILFHSGAAISLMFGLTYLSSGNASLLGSFELISTSLIAFLLFKENISKWLWIGIIFIFSACVIISLGDLENLNFSIGSILCLISPICFGFANNFLKKISHKNPAISIGLIGLGGGLISLIVGFIVGERFVSFTPVIIEVSVGMISYGIALILFIYAERFVGASKTSAFFSLAPFIAIILSLIIFQEVPNYTFYIGLGLLVIGTVFASLDAMFEKSANKHL